MQTTNYATPLHEVLNRYIVFTNDLLDAGWHVYGSKAEFYENPYTYKFGAVKFFEKEGVLHSVSAALNTDDTINVPSIAFVREYNLSGEEEGFDGFVKVFENDSKTLDSTHADALIEMYSDTVMLDFDKEENKFLGYLGGNNAMFMTPDGKRISKAISLTKVSTMSVLEAGYLQEQAEKTAGIFDSYFQASV